MGQAAVLASCGRLFWVGGYGGVTDEQVSGGHAEACDGLVFSCSFQQAGFWCSECSPRSQLQLAVEQRLFDGRPWVNMSSSCIVCMISKNCLYVFLCILFKTILALAKRISVRCCILFHFTWRAGLKKKNLNKINPNYK